MSGRFIKAVSIAAAIAASGSAFAADLPSRKPDLVRPPIAIEQGWAFTLNAYVWATGLEGRLRTLPPFPAVNVDLSFRDVLKNLDGGFMGGFEARNGRFILFSDLLISKVSSDRSIAVVGYPGNVGVSSFSAIGLAAVGYRVFDEQGFSMDLLGGVRGVTMTNKIAVQVVPVALSLDKTQSWADGVVGARLRYAFSDNWFATAIGFVGAGGSRYEWDVFAGLGYKINETFNAFVGYRALKMDYRRDNFIYDALQQGPVLGFQVKF